MKEISNLELKLQNRQLIDENETLKNMIKELYAFIYANKMKYDTKTSKEFLLLKKAEQFMGDKNE